MVDHDPQAPAGVGRGRGAAAWLVGVLVAVASWYAIVRFLPRPWSGRNLIPYELAAMVGSLAGAAVAAVGNARWRRRLGLMALAWLTCLVFLVGLIESTDRDLLHRRQFHRWVPILAGVGCFLWSLAYAVERALRRRSGVFTALIVGVALCAVTLQVGKYMHDSLAGDRVRAWNVYHYYVGSKYFPELGYFGLYAATLAADDAFQLEKKTAHGKEARRLKKVRDFAPLKKARDMRDYLVKPRKDIVASFSEFEMSPRRFAQLGRDTRFLRTYMGIKPPGWTNTVQDLGYNPGPAWTLVGVPLANLVPPRWPWFHLISNSDVPFFVLTFLLLWWGFGLRVASAMALWTCTIQFNESRFAGGFLQYDWFASTLACAAFYRRGWYRAAGVSLTWGAMTRVFPGFLILPFVIYAARDGLAAARRGGRDPLRAGWRGIRARHRAFLLAFTIGCGVLFVGSHFTGRGLQTWPGWVEKIARHSHNHAVTSNQRVGVGRLAIHAPAKGRFWAERTGDREKKLDAGRPTKRALQLLGLGLLIPALWRRRDIDGFVLAMFSVFCAVVLSRYYASTWSVFFLLGAAGRPRAPDGDPDERPMVGPGADAGVMGFAGWLGGAVLLLMAATYYAPGNTTASYFYVNWLFYGLCVALLAGYLAGDVRAWWRARAAAGSAEGAVGPWGFEAAVVGGAGTGALPSERAPLDGAPEADAAPGEDGPWERWGGADGDVTDDGRGPAGWGRPDPDADATDPDEDDDGGEDPAPVEP